MGEMGRWEMGDGEMGDGGMGDGRWGDGENVLLGCSLGEKTLLDSYNHGWFAQFR